MSNFIKKYHDLLQDADRNRAVLGDLMTVEKWVKTKSRGRFRVTLEGADVTREPGRPELPVLPIVLAIPASGSEEDSSTRSSTWRSLLNRTQLESGEILTASTSWP